MGISRSRAQDYAEEILEKPRAAIPLTLKRSKSGVTLLHRGRAVTKCHATGVGELQAEFMAEALGAGLPESGSSTSVQVPAGVFYRAIAISSLDLRKPEARVLLEQYLTTAQMQRSGMRSIEA